MQVKILLSRSLIDKTISEELGNIIVHSIINPITPVLNQFKKNGVIRDWSNERIVRYILALSLSYIVPMIINDKEDINIDKVTNEIVEVGEIKPDDIYIPGILVDYVVQGLTPEEHHKMMGDLWTETNKLAGVK